MSILKSNQLYAKDNKLTLDDLLSEIVVSEASEIPSTPKELKDWWVVICTQGVNSYFGTETEALAYRLFLINRTLNY